MLYSWGRGLKAHPDKWRESTSTFWNPFTIFHSRHDGIMKCSCGGFCGGWQVMGCICKDEVMIKYWKLSTSAQCRGLSQGWTPLGDFGVGRAWQ